MSSVKDASDASDAVVRAEAAYLADPSSVLLVELNRSRAEYILRTRMEEDFWRQKSAVRWVVERERNTKFFQSLVKQKCVRTRIHSIHADGRIISDENELRALAASFSQHHLSNDMIFDSDICRDHFSVLPPSVDVSGLCDLPLSDEIRKAVFVRGFPVSHLAYADDVLIFTRASESGLVLLMEFLQHYSVATGQSVNVQKYNFYI
ncbi:hypothetical protein ACS0TY_019112 [Phlomoides rotata]